MEKKKKELVIPKFYIEDRHVIRYLANMRTFLKNIYGISFYFVRLLCRRLEIFN
jgi:hypothetical protein